MKIKIFLVLCCLGLSSVVSAQEESPYQKVLYLKGNDTLKYRIMYPKNFSETQQYPLVLFLHGGGERANDNEKQLVHGSKLFADEEKRNKFPAIVIFPQCPPEDYWGSVDVDRSTLPFDLNFKYEEGPTKSMSLVMDLMDETLKKSFVKQDQVYILGLSMGGIGTFELIYRKPEMFAAAVTICGAGIPSSVANYAKSLPIWVFHGSKDDLIDPKWSIDMVKALLQAGGFPKFTLYDNANHNSWDPALAEPELLPWLFSKSK